MKKLIKHVFLLTLVFIIPCYLFSQNCGVSNNSMPQSYLDVLNGLGGHSSSSDFVLNTVFHIIQENQTDVLYSDQEILGAVDQFNSLFGNQANGLSVKIQLAEIDPDSNCTTGITRHIVGPGNSIGGLAEQSQLDDALKQVVLWREDNYFNVWIVKDIANAGVSAYAYNPLAVQSAGIDDGGVIIKAGYMDVPENNALMHEVGHYLGLLHIFTQGPSPGCEVDEEGENYYGADGLCDTAPANINLQNSDVPNCNINLESECEGVNCSVLCLEDPSDCMVFMKENFMTNTYKCHQSITPLQANIIIDVISSHRQDVLTSESDFEFRAGPHIVSGNVNWDKNYIIDSDIIIKGGAELNISSKVNFVVSGSSIPRIIVEDGGKLRLSGAELNSLCSDSWGGIIVNGDPLDQNNSGIVEYLAGSTIKNATIAITSFSGLIIGNASTISNCQQAIQINSGLPNLANSFTDCDFHDLNDGVEIRNNISTSFTRCYFLNIVNDGIRSINTPIMVTGNNQGDASFTNCQNHGIRQIFTELPMQSSTISIVEFTNCRKAILLSGNNRIENNIENNLFIGNLIGIEFDRINSGNVFLNTFVNNEFDEMMASTDNPIFYNSNQHSAEKICVTAAYNNNGFSFSQNCFEGNGIADVYSFGDFSPTQGNTALSASNCFNQANQIDFRYFGSNHLQYFIPNPTLGVDACYTPRDYINTQDADNNDDANCAIESNPIGVNPVIQCISDTTLTGMIAELNDQNTLLLSHTRQSCVESVTPDYDYFLIELCIRKLVSSIELIFLKQGAYSNLIQLLSQQVFFDLRAKALAVYHYQRDFTGARNYLRNNLTPCTPEHYDFITVQKYNLEYLEYGTRYIPSSGALDTVRQIAEKTDPLAAYANALYYLLTDQWLTIDYPIIPELPGSMPRSSEKATYSVYPNPTKEILYVKIDGAEMTTMQVEIFDLTGRKYISQKVEDTTTTLNTSSLETGLYLLHISSAGKTVLIKQIMIVN